MSAAVALGVHDLGGGDAGEVELHRQRLGEQTRIALCDAGAAALAHADLDDAERFKRAQRVARHDAAGAEARGQILFGAEEIAGPEPLGEQVVAHLRDDLRRQRGGAAGEHDARREVAADLHRLPSQRGLRHCKLQLGNAIIGQGLKVVKITSFDNFPKIS
jgi:hypothetical protein